jgi:Ca2+/Na+ antiporter
MQSKCKVKQVILLASSSEDVVYLFYEFHFEPLKENKMSYRLMFTINAIVAAVFGALFFIMPEFVLTRFGAETYVATLFAARFFGGAMIMMGLLLWFLKDVTPVKMQKNVAMTLLAGSVVGFILSLFGITSIHIFRANGWVLLVVFGLFSLIYAYLLFLQPKPSEAKPRSPRKTKDTQSPNSGQSV